jgi:hypothetical protein
MDKGTPQEVAPRIPRPTIPEMKDWDTWFKFTHEELIKHIARIDSHILTLEAFRQKAVQLGDRDGIMTLTVEITALSQISALNSLCDLVVQYQNELREQHEKVENQISKLTGMLEPLEPFLPILTKFAEEKKKEDEEKAKWR